MQQQHVYSERIVADFLLFFWQICGTVGVFASADPVKDCGDGKKNVDDGVGSKGGVRRASAVWIIPSGQRFNQPVVRLMMVLGSLLHARKPGVPTNEVWAKHEPPASLCAERKAWHFACWGGV